MNIGPNVTSWAPERPNPHPSIFEAMWEAWESGGEYARDLYLTRVLGSWYNGRRDAYIEAARLYFLRKAFPDELSFQ